MKKPLFIKGADRRAPPFDNHTPFFDGRTFFDILISSTFSTTTYWSRNFQNFTGYETVYTLFMTSKIFKIGPKFNMVIDVEMKTYFNVRKFDVLLAAGCGSVPPSHPN